MKKVTFPTVTQSDIEKAFSVKADIYNALDQKEAELEKSGDKDASWNTRYNDDFLAKDSKKVGYLWEYDREANGRKVEGKKRYSIWRDYPSYGTGKSMEEVLRLSETEKVLLKTKEFKISLVRNRILPKTSTKWSYTIDGYTHCLFDKNGKVLIDEEKEWRFKGLCLDPNFNAKNEPATIEDKLKTVNPFKLKIVPLRDKDAIKNICEKYTNAEICRKVELNGFSKATARNYIKSFSK